MSTSKSLLANIEHVHFELGTGWPDVQCLQCSSCTVDHAVMWYCSIVFRQKVSVILQSQSRTDKSAAKLDTRN